MKPNIDNLLITMKNGVPMSFDAIYVLYTPLIESMAEKYIRVFGLPLSESDDLKQEAAIALYNAATSYIPMRGVSFGLYSKICIKNRLVSYIRHCFGKSVCAESIDEAENDLTPDTEGTPEDLVVNRESLIDLHSRIDHSLTELEQNVFSLYLGAMSYDDMAIALGISRKSVDNAIQRVKSKLRKLL